MTAEEFLRLVWPDTGIYCLAIPQQNVQGDSFYKHYTFEDIAAAAAFAEQYKLDHNIFFGVFTLNKHKYWDDKKKNKRTGVVGGWSVRTQVNSHQSRVIFFDLDVGGSSTTTRKYPSRAEAIRSIMDFINTTGLPRPTLVSSGGGFHGYLHFAEPVEAAVWRGYAKTFRDLAKAHGVILDVSRTDDTASVLRVAGTFNLKQIDNPRPVQLLRLGEMVANDELIARLQTAAIQAGVSVASVAAPRTPRRAMADDELPSNTQKFYDGPPTSVKAVAEACPLFLAQLRLQGNVPENQWFRMLQILIHCENGRKIAHNYSKGHPQYSFSETEAKLDRLLDLGVGPTTCDVLSQACDGEDICSACPHFSKVKSPIVAGRAYDVVPPPVLQFTTQSGVVEDDVELPDPPFPYKRIKDGVAITVKNKDDEEFTTVIYEHDLFPIRRVFNAEHGEEQQWWRVKLPYVGFRDFAMPSESLYDMRQFTKLISNQGIYPSIDNIKALQGYMIAYITELQKAAKAEMQTHHLGWTKEKDGIVLGERMVKSDGTVKRVSLSLQAARAAVHITKSGTLEKQVELLNFYNRPEYIPHQFYIMSGLGSLLFYATDHHGMVINATGLPGASKSSCLYTAAAFWGSPKQYVLNGTQNGATIKTRNEYVSALANLPVGVDEITKMPVKDAIDLAMSISQPGGRLRLDSSGLIRQQAQHAKSTIMMTTSNNSLHTLISQDSSTATAGSMRVFEVVFEKLGVHTAAEANDMLHELFQNYGHIGEAFASVIVRDEPTYAARVRELQNIINVAAKMDGGERFWPAIGGANVAAAEIAYNNGLCPFHPQDLLDWVINVQIPALRGIVASEYVTPVGIISDYIERINGNTIIARSPTKGPRNVTHVIREPRGGALLGHYDLDLGIMYVLKTPLKDYCTQMGANLNRILSDLAVPNGNGERIIIDPGCRKVLGAGTDFAKSQSTVVVINMRHPDMSSAGANLTLVSGDADPALGPTPQRKLTVIK